MQTTKPECRRLRDGASDYLDGYMPDNSRSAVEGHLRSCSSCHAFVGELKATVDLLSGLREPSAAEAAKAQVLRSFGEYFPEPDLPDDLADWTPAKQAWGELAAMASDERLQAIRERDDYLDPALVDWLVSRARKGAFARLGHALTLAEAAVEIARQLHLRFRDTRRLFLALDALAGCLTGLRQFSAAALILEELGALLKRDQPGSEIRTRYLTTKGLYHSHAGRHNEASHCLNEALDLARKWGSRREVLCQLSNLAGTELTAGRVHRALELSREAEGLLQPRDAPRLRLGVYCNLLLALCEARQTTDAGAVLLQMRDLANAVGGWYFRTYVTWSEGTLLRAERRYREAEELFDAVRAEFRARGHEFLYVEASLDLAQIHLSQGRLQDLGTLASELLHAVEEDGTDERLRAAVVGFAQAVRQGTLTSQAIGSVAVALSSARLSLRH